MSLLINYVIYDQFKEIPRQTRATIMKKLGVSGGVMRAEAKEFNPMCAVAFSGTKPVGWATIGYYTGHISVFVTPLHRGRGIGTALVNELCAKVSCQVISFPFNKKGLDFYSRFDKIICDEDNLQWIDEQEVEKLEKANEKRCRKSPKESK